ncbi:conserved hypothetical protein [Moraxellaceae bacterium 17A]|nr:conserved hypothetical protein [Moraxellaceae bacterium 17A]
MFGINTKIAQQQRERQIEQSQFDGIKEAAEQIQAQHDPIAERIAISAIASMRIAAMSIVLSTALIVTEGQGDIDPEDEMLPSEVLDNLTLEQVQEDDEDDDTEIDPMVKSVLSAHVADAFSSLGVGDDVINDLFASDTDVADTAIESACQTVVENLPEDGDPLDEFVMAFAFGYDAEALVAGGSDEDTEEGYDGAMFDSNKKKLQAGKKTIKKIGGHTITYEAVKVMRHGKLDVINKRISGHIKLTGKQKSALRKARKKAHSGFARLSRVKSIGRGINQIYKNHLDGKGLNFLAAISGKKAESKGNAQHLADMQKIGRMRNKTKKANALTGVEKQQRRYLDF